VLTWDPPSRVVLAWQLTNEWAYDPAFTTEVEVRFIPEGESRTRVELEHRDLDRYGEHGQAMQDAFGSPNGWSGLLERYAAAAA
jgi:uncharacterized protein YndB with AHSA1/START domain